jgi:hypothetical protein
MGRARICALAAVCSIAAGPRAAAAASEVLSFGDGGLRMEKATIFEGKVDGAAFDPAQELVWFSSGGVLNVIDLRDATLAVVQIAKGIPDGAFAVAGLSNANYLVDDWATPYPRLRIATKKGKKSKIEVGVGPDVGTYPKEDRAAKKAIKKMKIVGAKWLAAQRTRTPREAPAASTTTARVSLPAELDACEDEANCGVARTLGGRYQLVVVEDACTEVCATSCLLYDPVRKKFASLTQSEARWGGEIPKTANCADDYRICHEDTRYFVGSHLCTIGDTIKCTDAPGWTYFGWADRSASTKTSAASTSETAPKTAAAGRE